MTIEQDNARDAERYRKLVAIFQQTYDGQPYDRPAREEDAPYFTASAHMIMGRRDYRLMEATITWSDTRDEPLDLGSALDAIPAESLGLG